MALFPPEFIAGLLVAFLQFRLRAYCSLASWLVNNLSFFMPPEDELIDTLNGKPPPTSKNSSKTHTPLSPDAKMQALYVKVGTTTHGVFQQTLFYELYEMLVIVVTSTLTACAVSDALAFTKPWLASTAIDASASPSPSPTPTYRAEVSAYGLVSVLLVALWFPLQIKFAHGLATYEARLGVAIGALGAIGATFALFAPQQLVDYDVEHAAATIGERIELVMRAIGFGDADIAAVAPVATLARTLLFVTLAMCAGIFTSTAFLPAFRFARMYIAMTREQTDASRVSTLLLHVNMLAPLIVAVLWLKPLARDVFVPSYLVPCGSNDLLHNCFATPADEAMFHATKWHLTESQFVTLRVQIVLASVSVRLLCFRRHLQFFLLEVRESYVALVRRPGKVDGPLLQNKVRVQFNYVPIIAVQYLAPVAATLAAAVLLVRQTGVSMGVTNGIELFLTRVCGMALPAAHVTNAQLLHTDAPDFGDWRLGDDVFARNKMSQFIRGMAQFAIVPPDAHASILGFVLCWLSFTWFAVSAAGLVYWQNVPHFTSGTESDAAALEMRRNKQTPKLIKNQLKSLKMKKQH